MRGSKSHNYEIRGIKIVLLLLLSFRKFISIQSQEHYDRKFDVGKTFTNLHDIYLACV
jgi:hypothetical protein